MNKLDFIDAHVHFYDMQHPELFYGHWQPGEPHPKLGMQIQKLAERNYLAENYIMETRNANVTKVVHIQAAIGSKDPVKETAKEDKKYDPTGNSISYITQYYLEKGFVQVTCDDWSEKLTKEQNLQDNLSVNLIGEDFGNFLKTEAY